ncbi:NAD(P)-binding protein [Aspergillus ellipticus CBS 707.79]|uniref:D-xylose 1-dehydrogenase (NADP(+), D-xylono-1,5-lactone-forming) n=1 Tax=Aspergillus ellipticus CBS 707.79 TaxID=1448320 RepID=A0A319CYI3_9EURO|nr:NAD(P)-binding protein [Aspergillus ellipticus CBS 707.79]
MDDGLPALRWGIIGAGMIASWFTVDLSLECSDAGAIHTIQVVGSSSLEKAQKFKAELRAKAPLVRGDIACYDSYAEVFTDPQVDIVYIATPHAAHRQNCLDAIHHGKHILCEKPFTVNAREAIEVIEAARAKGVFVMEGMWTRFHPLARKMVDLLHQEKIIGQIQRAFVDFGLDMPIQDLPPSSRLRDVALGAGSLLDLGIYSLTWGILALEGEPDPGKQQVKPKISACQSIDNQIDLASSVLVYYPEHRCQGILSSTVLHKTDAVFDRVEGSLGTLTVEGFAPMPDKITVYLKPADAPSASEGRGFYYEADSIAKDIANGRTESAVIPLSETLRVLEILDEVRRQGGARYPQDQD